jgi:transcriptional regulator with XRE-family HTH domain
MAKVYAKKRGKNTGKKVEQTEKKPKHIGEKIEEIFKKSGLKGTEFAALINKDRQVIYNIFKRENIGSTDLKKISKVLDYNFFTYYSREFLGIDFVHEPPDNYSKQLDLIASLGLDLQAANRRIDEIEEKYELLQKLNKLQEEKLEDMTNKAKK